VINPFPLVWAIMRRHAVVSVTFVLLIALAVGIGAAITAQERALRSGSARASDKFDLIVGAPGSQIDLLLRVVFLQQGAVELLSGDAERKLLGEDRAEFVAPIGFGDSYAGHPVVGTIPQLVMRLSGDKLAEGRNFETPNEAVIGSDSDLAVGDVFHATHGLEEAEGEDHEHEHQQSITVVGRLAATGTPWDRAILTPIELTWMVHELGNGHGNAPIEKVGPPFDLASVPGIPAAVVKPKTVAAAYGLRSEYRTTETTAFFPAEVLVQLYELIGDVRVVMSGLAIATEVLLVAAILAGILMLMRLYRQRFAVLRALGASRTYVLAVAWTFSFGLIAIGSLLGLAVAAALVGVVSGIFSRASGIAMTTSIGWPEIWLALTLTAVGAVLAILPAALLYRRPVVEALRSA
jgi:putative ABC transport system permease protein